MSSSGIASPRARPRDELDGVDDLDVAGAAAQVAGERPRDLVAARRRRSSRADPRPS